MARTASPRARRLAAAPSLGVARDRGGGANSITEGERGWRPRRRSWWPRSGVAARTGISEDMGVGRRYRHSIPIPRREPSRSRTVPDRTRKPRPIPDSSPGIMRTPRPGRRAAFPRCPGHAAPQNARGRQPGRPAPSGRRDRDAPNCSGWFAFRALSGPVRGAQRARGGRQSARRERPRAEPLSREPRRPSPDSDGAARSSRAVRAGPWRALRAPGPRRGRAGCPRRRRPARRAEPASKRRTESSPK